MKTLDTATRLEAQSVAQYSTGGFALRQITMRARRAWLKKYMCGHLLKADARFTPSN